MTLSATTAGCFLTKVYSSSFVCHWRKPIDLCRHDEIVLVETLDLLGAQRHSPIAPAEANVGMVTFRLRKLANLLDEYERLPEVPETKGLFDPARIIHERPFRSLWEEFFGFRSCQRRDAAAARGASFLDERFRHGVLRQSHIAAMRPAYPIKRRRARREHRHPKASE